MKLLMDEIDENAELTLPLAGPGIAGPGTCWMLQQRTGRSPHGRAAPSPICHSGEMDPPITMSERELTPMDWTLEELAMPLA